MSCLVRPEQALHAIVVACACILLGIAQELLVHAVVEGVPQEVAPEAIQPVHLIGKPWACAFQGHCQVRHNVWYNAGFVLAELLRWLVCRALMTEAVQQQLSASNGIQQSGLHQLSQYGVESEKRIAIVLGTSVWQGDYCLRFRKQAALEVQSQACSCIAMYDLQAELAIAWQQWHLSLITGSTKS